MSTIYDRADIYDIGFDERKWDIISEHWKKVFENTQVENILDCSIGSGNLTLPLSKIDIKISGSDLSQTMLNRCEEKAQKRGIAVELFQSNFLQINKNTPRNYYCVMSTGNSLPYVSNNEVIDTLEKMNSIVNEGGYLYLDMRNWDKIIKEQQRFYFYNPTFIDNMRVDTVQFWDYNLDGTITFNIVYNFEKMARFFSVKSLKKRIIQ